MRGVKVDVGRNAKSQAYQGWLNGLYFGRDMYDPAHQHCHLKSELCDEVLSLDECSAARIGRADDRQARLESCLAASMLRCHRICCASWIDDGPKAEEYQLQSRSLTL